MDGARAVTGRRTRPLRPIFFASVSFLKRNAETNFKIDIRAEMRYYF